MSVATEHTLEHQLDILIQLARLGDVTRRLSDQLWLAGWSETDVQRELSRLATLPDAIRLGIINDYRDRVIGTRQGRHPIEEALRHFKRQQQKQARANKTRRGT